MILHLRALAEFLRDVCHPCQAADRIIDAHVAAALAEPVRPATEAVATFNAVLDGDFLWLCGEDA